MSLYFSLFRTLYGSPSAVEWGRLIFFTQYHNARPFKRASSSINTLNNNIIFRTNALLAKLIIMLLVFLFWFSFAFFIQWNVHPSMCMMAFCGFTFSAKKTRSAQKAKQIKLRTNSIRSFQPSSIDAERWSTKYERRCSITSFGSTYYLSLFIGNHFLFCFINFVFSQRRSRKHVSLLRENEQIKIKRKKNDEIHIIL